MSWGPNNRMHTDKKGSFLALLFLPVMRGLNSDSGRRKRPLPQTQRYAVDGRVRPFPDPGLQKILTICGVVSLRPVMADNGQYEAAVISRRHGVLR